MHAYRSNEYLAGTYNNNLMTEESVVSDDEETRT